GTFSNTDSGTACSETRKTGRHISASRSDHAASQQHFPGNRRDHYGLTGSTSGDGCSSRRLVSVHP
ncbi:hypothetical protein, partial [Desulfosarcina sp.]|uniref:hypothetical protein n=1 Tax=Desulfosarcina sp. TaxID=2027861 RepID=UPI0029B10F1C